VLAASSARYCRPVLQLLLALAPTQPPHMLMLHKWCPSEQVRSLLKISTPSRLEIRHQCTLGQSLGQAVWWWEDVRDLCMAAVQIYVVL
jgi:hypothetical protein